MKLSVHLHLVPRLEKRGSIPPRPHMLPWSVLGQLYLYLFFLIKEVILLIIDTHIIRINVGLYHKQDWRQVKDCS